MNLVQQSLASLVGPKCAPKLLNINTVFEDMDCLKLLLSKGLGIGIVLGGIFLKVPQIIKIVSRRSGKGISFLGYLLETISFTITVAYNWRNQKPLSTYGEAIFINIQNLFILLLLLFYSRNFPGLIIVASLFSVAMYALSDATLVTSSLLVNLQWSTIIIGTVSKLPQVYYNFLNKSTGQLSAITVFLQFAGSAARIFTTLQEVKDIIILTSFMAATTLNAVIVLQMIIYWDATKIASKGPITSAAKAAKKRSPKAA